MKNSSANIPYFSKQLDNLAKISEEKLKQQALKTADSVDRLVTNMKNINLNPIEDVAFAGVGRMYSSVENTDTIRDMVSKIVKSSEKEINFGGGVKGTVKDSNGIKDLDNVTRISEVEVNFNYKTKFDSEEFTRQLKDQEKGMNELTVYEYQQNRKRFIEEGRAIESNVAQQAAREKALSKKVEELFESGMSWDEAEKKAESWLKTQAALHNPDQIAGGNPLDVGGVGDKRINSSIGSQWKFRIDLVDEKIEEMAKNMTPDQLKSMYLNVKLTH